MEKNKAKLPPQNETQYCSKVLEATKEYINSGYNTVPSIVGLALHLQVSRQTLYNWQKENEEFKEVCDQIQSKQYLILVDKGLVNEYNSAIVKLMLANHGLSDKQEVNHSSSDGSMSPKINIYIPDNGRDTD